MRKMILLISLISSSIALGDITNFNELVRNATVEETLAHKEFLQKVPDNQLALEFHEKMEEIRLREALLKTNFSIQLVDGH
jgi:hypothetical protein